MPANRPRARQDNGKPHPAANYIGEITKELARLARVDGCDTLSYLLELAALEAEIMGDRPEGCLVS